MKVWKYTALGLMAPGFSVLALIVLSSTLAPTAVARTLAPAARSSPLDGPVIQALRAISIPYGFEDAYPIYTNGRQVAVSATGACEAGQQLRLHITVTQEAMGAHGEGRAVAFCTGEEQTVDVRVMARGPDGFVAGPAHIAGSATTRERGKVTDQQLSSGWQRETTLVEGG